MRHDLSLKRALILVFVGGAGCDDASKPELRSDASHVAPTRDAAVDASSRDAETLDSASGADARLPAPSDAASEASARDASERDARAADATADGAITDSGAFTPQDCTACTHQLAAAVCSGSKPVHWECLSMLNSAAVARLGSACDDRGTALPRWCCPAKLAPECGAP